MFVLKQWQLSVVLLEGKDYQAPDKNGSKEAFNKGLCALSREYSGRDNLMITIEHCVHELSTLQESNPHFGRAGTKITANRIGNGIQQPEVIFLRCFLGKDMFNALLTCCGTPTSRDKPSPLDDPSQGEVWGREQKQQDYQDNRDTILAQKQQQCRHENAEDP